MNRKIGSGTTKAHQRGASSESKSAHATSGFFDSTDVSAVEVQDELEEEKAVAPKRAPTER
jgi:hypothetical protein